MRRCALRQSNNQGFTIVEVIVSLVLVAAGMALMFQSITGATKIQAAAIELQQTKIVAHNILAGSGADSENASGVLDGIAWTLTAEPIAKNQMGMELIRIRIVASGTSGRQVVLVGETLRKAL